LKIVITRPVKSQDALVPVLELVTLNLFKETIHYKRLPVEM
jgi:hypothetical protein